MVFDLLESESISDLISQSHQHLLALVALKRHPHPKQYLLQWKQQGLCLNQLHHFLKRAMQLLDQLNEDENSISVFSEIFDQILDWQQDENDVIFYLTRLEWWWTGNKRFRKEVETRIDNVMTILESIYLNLNSCSVSLHCLAQVLVPMLSHFVSLSLSDSLSLLHLKSSIQHRIKSLLISIQQHSQTGSETRLLLAPCLARQESCFHYKADRFLADRIVGHLSFNLCLKSHDVSLSIEYLCREAVPVLVNKKINSLVDRFMAFQALDYLMHQMDIRETKCMTLLMSVLVEFWTEEGGINRLVRQCFDTLLEKWKEQMIPWIEPWIERASQSDASIPFSTAMTLLKRTIQSLRRHCSTNLNAVSFHLDLKQICVQAIHTNRDYFIMACEALTALFQFDRMQMERESWCYFVCDWVEKEVKDWNEENQAFFCRILFKSLFAVDAHLYEIVEKKTWMADSLWIHFQCAAIEAGLKRDWQWMRISDYLNHSSSLVVLSALGCIFISFKNKPLEQEELLQKALSFIFDFHQSQHREICFSWLKPCLSYHHSCHSIALKYCSDAFPEETRNVPFRRQWMAMKLLLLMKPWHKQLVEVIMKRAMKSEYDWKEIFEQEWVPLTDLSESNDSSNASDSDTLFSILLREHHVQTIETTVRQLSSHSQYYQDYLQRCFDAIHTHLTLIKESGIELASRQCPLMGVLSLLNIIQSKSKSLLLTESELNLLLQVQWEMMPVLSHASPEGREDREDSLEGEDTLADGVSLIVATCCWKSLVLVTEILTHWMLQENDNSPYCQRYLSQSIHLLLNVRHCGAYRHCYPLLSKVCQQWHESLVMQQEMSQHFHETLQQLNEMDIVRRSAGLPFCLMALCTGNASLLDELMQYLMKSMEESNGRSIHAFHILRALLKEAKFKSIIPTEKYALLEQTLIATQSSHWSIRNASQMLLAVLLNNEKKYSFNVEQMPLNAGLLATLYYGYNKNNPVNDHVLLSFLMQHLAHPQWQMRKLLVANICKIMKREVIENIHISLDKIVNDLMKEKKMNVMHCLFMILCEFKTFLSQDQLEKLQSLNVSHCALVHSLQCTLIGLRNVPSLGMKQLGEKRRLMACLKEAFESDQFEYFIPFLSEKICLEYLYELLIGKKKNNNSTERLFLPLLKTWQSQPLLEKWIFKCLSFMNLPDHFSLTCYDIPLMNESIALFAHLLNQGLMMTDSLQEFILSLSYPHQSDRYFLVSFYRYLNSDLFHSLTAKLISSVIQLLCDDEQNIREEMQCIVSHHLSLSYSCSSTVLIESLFSRHSLEIQSYLKELAVEPYKWNASTELLFQGGVSRSATRVFGREYCNKYVDMEKLKQLALEYIL